MAHLIRTGQASGLQDAYQRVIADLGFQQRQQPQAQQRQAQQAAAPRKSAKDAKKAAVGLRSGNTGSPGEAPASLRDELRMRLSKSAR
jgi:hypothetical protein